MFFDENTIVAVIGWSILIAKDYVASARLKERDADIEPAPISEDQNPLS